MGLCFSKNKPKIRIAVIQSNGVYSQLLTHDIYYKFANIHVEYNDIDILDTLNCNFVILIKNGDIEQNADCIAKLNASGIKYYELPELPESGNHFRNYIYLFSRMYLFS